MKNKIETETTRENMLAILYAQDFWKEDFLNEMCDEDLLEFGIKQGVWSKISPKT